MGLRSIWGGWWRQEILKQEAEVDAVILEELRESVSC